MTQFSPQDDFRSWGNVLKAQHSVARPVWRDQLQSAVLNGRQLGLTLLGAGLRRSYGDSGLNPGGGMIDMFGGTLLEAVGGPFDATRHAYWFKLALKPNPINLSTPEHLLLQALIDGGLDLHQVYVEDESMGKMTLSHFIATSYEY